MLILFIFTGCTVWKTNPSFVKTSNPYFTTKLSTEDFSTMDLSVTNNTDNNIEIIWAKTFYVDQSGGTNGGFTLGKEIHWEEKDLGPYPVVVFPHTDINKQLYPLAHRSWNRGWHRTTLNMGKHGILLTMKVDDREITEKLFFEVTYEKKNPIDLFITKISSK